LNPFNFWDFAKVLWMSRAENKRREREEQATAFGDHSAETDRI
jgi:hypothetical protein